MHTCNCCGKTFKIISKLKEHNNRQTPCRPATHHCPTCNKGLASLQSLSNHKQRCTFGDTSFQPPTHQSNAGVKRPNITVGSGKSTNPKIQALLDEIINDDDPKRNVPSQTLHKGFSIVPPTSPSPMEVSTPAPSTPPSTSPKKMLFSSPKQILQKPSTDVLSSTSNILPKSKSPPRTKGDIVGYSDDESSEKGDSSESEESITSKSDGDDSENVDMEVEEEEFILPDTIEGIQNRFNDLYVEFVRKGKHENRNELQFLLDEMLSQGAIDPAEYTQLNTRLTKVDDHIIDKEEKEEEEEAEDDENITNATIQYMIQHDREELQDLIEEIKDDIDEEFIDIVLDIEKLLEEFLVNEFFDGELIRSQINTLLNQLERSKIPKSKQHRIKMLLDDIEKNRYRVEQIFQRLMDADNKDEMLTVLKTLVNEGHISDVQFERLAELEDPDLNDIKEIITDTKVGEGLNFLPRTISNLRYTLKTLLTELKEGASAVVKSKITAIMEELLRRNAIRTEEYDNLKELTV